MASEQVSNSALASAPQVPPLKVMESEQFSGSILASTPQIPPLQAWLGRLGISGKVLAIGGLVGVIAVFLPLFSMSMSMQFPGGANGFGGKGSVNISGISHSQSVSVIADWRGVLCLVGYVAALALSYVLYAPKELGPKNINWAGLGVGGFIALLALWLLGTALSGSGGMMGFQISVGFGAILNFLAAATVATGGFLKAREEKLF